MYRGICGHCHKDLSDKAFKEHKRLYFQNGAWISESKVEDGVSNASEPMTLSDPPSSTELQNVNEEADSIPPPATDGQMSDLTPDLWRERSDEMAIEYWAEGDDDLLNDCESEPEDCMEGSSESHLNESQESAVWWIVAFTCIIQSLHSLPARSVDFLLKFLYALLTFLGRYSPNIAEIANAFPSTMYSRSKYLQDKLSTAPLVNRVVCQQCHTLYKFSECMEKHGTAVQIKHCSECRNHIPLLKVIITSNGNKRYYPFSIYPYCSLISVLKTFLKRPGFLELCNHWQQDIKDSSTLTDVYCGSVWKNYLVFHGSPFLSKENNIAFMLNIDWFQPFKHRTYSVGVMYLVFMNLPRSIRYKRENIVLLGLIPGPSEPPLHINSYLTPHVADLLSLWKGVSFDTATHKTVIIRCALLCVACDLPAGRKVCGFLSHAANLGCSKCYSTFATGVFGKRCYAGFNRELWIPRNNERHRRDIATIHRASSNPEKQRKIKEYGCRYSCLLQLPYFDPVKMLPVDPMHNLYLGTAKHILNKIWIKKDILDSVACKQINQRIATLIIPTNVTFSSIPATIEHCSSFTAEQMMIWVNYYSLVCLYNILPENHYECWRHFVLASRLLSKKCLSKNDILVADKLLLQFCRRFQDIYGKDAVTPNIHMHAHLTECIQEFGPMSSFWLFSFERYNGILGDQPTNNRSIEVQLMKRFIQDNSHIHFVTLGKETDLIFDKIVKEHAFNFHSMKHLDEQNSTMSVSGCTLTLASKYTISLFSSEHLSTLLNVYCELYPDLKDNLHSHDFALPSTHKKMFSVIAGEQKLNAGQFVFAKSIYDICSHSQSSVSTIFFDPTLHAAKIQYFFVHTFFIDNNHITRVFAVLSWLLCHPQRHVMGRPLQVWHHNVYEDSPRNFMTPVDNIKCLALTTTQKLEDQLVTITIPTI